jgi:NAD(P)-dependent dehydrogenase (short-subunit alcohol dehydrogenase family)
MVRPQGKVAIVTAGGSSIRAAMVHALHVEALRWAWQM